MTTPERHDSAQAYTPVTEEVTLSDLPVEGDIPRELDGLLLRNGPNPFGATDAGAHWFVGDGMIHGVRIQDGRARWYRNRWVRTGYLAWRRGEGPEPLLGDGDSPANTNVIGFAGRILALCEVGLPYEVQPTLETIGRHDFGGRLTGPMTAHPKLDPETGELILFGYSFAPPYLRYHVAGEAGAIVHSVEIDVPGPTMMHDCAITATRTLLLDLPVCFDPDLLNVASLPYRFKPEYGARVGILPRRGGGRDVRWFEIEPCYFFHTLNAYDDGPDRVVLLAARYPSMFEWSATEAHFLDAPLPYLYRYSFDLAAGTAKAEALDDLPLEFPRTDDRRLGRPHRYGYGVTVERRMPGELPAFRHLVKHDFVTGRREIHAVGADDMCSEPVLAPGRASGDGGWILAVRFDAERGASDVLLVDAADFSAPPRAHIRLPVRVPLGFHGNWLPARR
jgi:carotenoid cleavage dioxygenase-like enzyme